MRCRASEQGIRRTLGRIAKRFSAAQQAVDYGFILHRLDRTIDGRNWTAAATASVPWKADRIAEYQAALDALCTRIPHMD